MLYDLYERHQVVVTLLQGLPVQSVLDVGGRAGLLSRFTRYDVTALNVDGSGDVQYGGGVFPFPDGHFSAVVCIDTLEHLPKGERLDFLRECLRVAERYLVIAAPFGSPGHIDCEKRLDRLYRQVYGQPHSYLDEHVRYGLPDAAELEALSSRLGRVEHRLWFAGDYVWQGKYFERTLLLQQQRGWVSRLKAWFNHVFSLALFHPVRLQAQPYPSANRFYLFFEK
jgi:hypothetical protein